MAFQSTHNRKFHIGVLRTGAIKPAAATTPGSAEGRFTPKLVSAAVVSAVHACMHTYVLELLHACSPFTITKFP